jgi:hypothetical protein
VGESIDSRQESRLRTPREWIERRLEQISPDVSNSVIERLKRERDAATSVNSVSLQCSLNLSYFPNGIDQIASKAGLPGGDLLRSVLADLTDGIAVRTTSWTTKQGDTKVCLLGARWRLIVRPARGKNLGWPLALLESIEPLAIPTNQVRFRPISVGFHAIWDEKKCDLDELHRQYKASETEAEDVRRISRRLQRKIDETGKRRQELFRQVSSELGRGHADPAIQTRSNIHASVRLQYSALRVMMDLLQLRSEQEKYSTAAVVLRVDAPPPGQQTISVASPESAQESDAAETANLRLQLRDRAPEGVLYEDTLVELRRPAAPRARRARVVSVRNATSGPIIEVNLPPDAFDVSEDVEIHTVPRFGMWAHERAVQDLLEDRVQGYWPNLARLLCSPDELQVLQHAAPPKRFFCDADATSPSLNERQRMAVAGALSTPHAFCIQGPPGTGKTTVICELVQQLIASGERILLLAPTHVAVDEVLRRIGKLEGIRALRLSWDDRRVAPDVRKFTPSNIIDPFIERAQNPDVLKRDRWQQERDSIQAALTILTKLQEVQKQSAARQTQKRQADDELDRAEKTLAIERPILERRLEELRLQIATSETESRSLHNEVGDAETVYQKLTAEASWQKKLLGWGGLGELGRARRKRRSLAKQLKRVEGECERLRKEENAAKDRLNGLTTAVSDADGSMRRAESILAEAIREEQNVLESCAEHGPLRDRDLRSEAVGELVDELHARDLRLVTYKNLAGRFDELVAEVSDQGNDLEGLRRDLLAVTNLFCCTTTGVASRPELRDVVFDTLIVDEASRVTDSEFLIGAVRAERWILVGDEHQLPPYVEQNDEHFIHALSALHQAEATGKQLDQAVDELGSLWEEDEELHQFRRDSVCGFAERIRDEGQWKATYRDAYQTGIDYLRREVSEPSKALLQSMRNNLVHSLFERVVSSCPDALKVRLVEQRRMIEPIASIVSEPVYGGDYRTPAAEELARCGVKPLITPTFPKPVTFLDTSLLGKKAREELRRNSFVNPTEARWVVEACRTLDRELAQAGSGPLSVSILSFYKAQARLIHDMLADHPGQGAMRFACLRFSVIDAIDRIQGQESDVVFLSFCRTAGRDVSPLFGQWLQDLRRLNVACTRAHRALIFVGQKELLGKLCSNDAAVAFYRHLNELFETRPDVMRVVRQFGGRAS